MPKFTTTSLLGYPSGNNLLTDDKLGIQAQTAENSVWPRNSSAGLLSGLHSYLWRRLQPTLVDIDIQGDVVGVPSEFGI